VNLIGEHTDYNGGYVLPTAIPQGTRVEVAVRGGKAVRAWTANREEGDAILEYSLDREARGGGWLDYVQGVTQALARAGHKLEGFDLRVESDVPMGAGLSSSAALEVSLLRALRAAMSLSIDDVTIALLGQRAENDLVGAPVGVMDQMASSLADEATALFLDTRTMETKRVPMPEEADLVVISSGVTHNHAGGDYRTRRAECERAAELLGVRQLRDLTIEDIPRAMALPEPLGRRVRHIVTENERVLAAVSAMVARDLLRLGELFYASHLSMRDDYEISVPEVDMLVEIGRADKDILGARLTGGGFGGSVVMLARRAAGPAASLRIAREYAARSGRSPAVLVPPSPSVDLQRTGSGSI
jgi:galactokinase